MILKKQKSNKTKLKNQNQKNTYAPKSQRGGIMLTGAQAEGIAPSYVHC